MMMNSLVLSRGAHLALVRLNRGGLSQWIEFRGSYTYPEGLSVWCEGNRSHLCELV